MSLRRFEDVKVLNDFDTRLGENLFSSKKWSGELSIVLTNLEMITGHFRRKLNSLQTSLINLSY